MRGLGLIAAYSIVFFLVSCTTDNIKPPVDCSTEGPTLELLEVGGADCNTQNGFVKVMATGGTGNYQFKIDDGAFQSESEFSGLGSGTYVISLKDENTCETTLLVNVQNKDGVNLSLASTPAGCGGAAGTITAEGVGGEPPYLFKIGSDAVFQDDHVFANLEPGDYAVAVKDNTGCEALQTISVKSGVSFESDIKNIIETSCAINTCHNGNQFPDFRQFNNIKNNADKIKELTTNRTMPQEGSLTQNQINAIACWVDDGAPAN